MNRTDVEMCVGGLNICVEFTYEVEYTDAPNEAPCPVVEILDIRSSAGTHALYDFTPTQRFRIEMVCHDRAAELLGIPV